MTQQEFEAVYQIYFNRVYHFLYGMTKNEHLAEELTSDTFFKAMQAIDQFHGECQLGSWLCQIAKNTYFSYLKKCEKTGSLDAMAEEREFSSKEKTIEQQMLEQEDSAQIHRILHAMEEPYKEVFTLRVLGELSFRQIGDIFGKTENWACVTYHRARAKIRKEMEEKS